MQIYSVRLRTAGSRVRWQTATDLTVITNERNMLCQHVWRNMLCQHVWHNMLRSFVHHVGLCCMMLAYVASSLKPVKLSINMPAFLLFS